MAEQIISKQCSKCKKVKLLSEFYLKSNKRTGYRAQCKVCCNEYSYKYDRTEKAKTARREYKKSKRGKIAEKRYQQSEKGKVAYKRYDQSEKGKARHIRYHKKYKKKFPEKIKAKAAVMHAVTKGVLPKVTTLKCKCSKQAKHYHHHKGYAKEHWLDVIPVCEKCHNS